ncbi:lysophospholipid acyltransferase family protein [Shimia abyssi]
MDELVRSGQPVIIVAWHQRLILAPFIFNGPPGSRICALTSAARAGRLAGQIFVRFGWETIPMSSHKRHVTLSREVLRLSREGVSTAIAADGPRGPARNCSTVPIVWARTTGARVFVSTFAQKRVLRLPTWDKQMLPLPFSQGVIMGKEWTGKVPRKGTEEEYETLRLGIEAALDNITDAADAALGKPSEKF